MSKVKINVQCTELVNILRGCYIWLNAARLPSKDVLSGILICFWITV